MTGNRQKFTGTQAHYPPPPHCMLVERHACKEHWEIQGLMLQRLALFQVIEDQNERDQFKSDRMQKNCKYMQRS